MESYHEFQAIDALFHEQLMHYCREPKDNFRLRLTLQGSKQLVKN